MKKSLFLYLFIIAVLMNVFTYKYFSSKGSDEVNVLKVENKKLKDSTLIIMFFVVFSLSFFGNQGMMKSTLAMVAIFWGLVALLVVFVGVEMVGCRL